MQFFLYILLALLILLVMITIHETGHYIAAKIFQFKVVEFSIGFGPALFSKTKKNGEKFSIRLIPLGGYCAFEAEDENGEISESSYYNEAPWKRIIVLLSGGAFNLITAVLFSFIYILAVGHSSPNAIVVHQLTLDAAGRPVAVQLYEGDIIREVNGVQIVQEMVPEYPGARTRVLGPYAFNNLVRNIGPNESVELLVTRGRGRNAEDITITIVRQLIPQEDFPGFGFAVAVEEGGTRVTAVAVQQNNRPWVTGLYVNDIITHVDGVEVGNTQINRIDRLLRDVSVGGIIDITVRRENEGVITTHTVNMMRRTITPHSLAFGFTQEQYYQRVSFGRALLDAVPFAARMSIAVLRAFGQAITGRVPVTDLAGPFGTIGFMAEVSAMNWRNIFILFPLLSANLGLLNLFPFPAFDGLKVIFTTVEWIRKKPINRNVENMIHLIGMLVLMLFVFTLDIVGCAMRGRATGPPSFRL